MNSSITYCSDCGASNEPESERCFRCGKALQTKTLSGASDQKRFSTLQMLKKRPFSSEDTEHPELSKAAFWKTMAIGIAVGTLSFFVASAPGSNILAWLGLAIDILAVVGAGFITGRMTRLIGMGFAMGFLAGLTFYTVGTL